MKLKRVHKVIASVSLVFVMIFGVCYLNGINAGEQNLQIWIMALCHFVGFWTGIITYSAGIDAAKRMGEEI